MKTEQEVIDLFEKEFGILPFIGIAGPNKSTLLFYGKGKHNLIVQVFPTAGWDVYVNLETNKVSTTIETLKEILK